MIRCSLCPFASLADRCQSDSPITDEVPPQSPAPNAGAALVPPVLSHHALCCPYCRTSACTARHCTEHARRELVARRQQGTIDINDQEAGSSGRDIRTPVLLLMAPRDGRERFQMGEAGEPQQGNPNVIWISSAFSVVYREETAWRRLSIA